MRLIEALQIEPLSRGELVAGKAGLQRMINWVHVVDLPDPAPWIGRNQFLLTTGVSWSQNGQNLRRLISELDSQGVAGIGLAVPGYLDRAPLAVREEADRVGLPLIELPWDIPFSEISERINRAMLTEQQLISQQSEAVHRALTRAAIEAESLDEIVHVLSELIHRAISLEDPEGNLLAAHGDEYSSDPVRMETVARGGSVPRIAQRLRESGDWARILHTRKPMRIRGYADLGFSSRVVCPIWLKDELVGVVWILEGETPLGDLDFRAAEHAAIVAALHIARDRAVVSVETRLGYSLVDLLLEGQFQEDSPNLERAFRLGFDPDIAYRVALFALSEPTSLGAERIARRDRLMRRIARRAAAHSMPVLMSASLNQVSVLFPDGMDVRQIWGEIADPSLRLCIGRVHPGIAGVRKSYLEARSILAWVNPGTMARYETYLVPRLLKGDRSARKEFADDLLGPIMRSQRGKQEQTMLSTLIVLGKCGFNQTKAAERLGIHIKTMHYRSRRLQEITGKDFADPDVRFRVQLLGHLIELESMEIGNALDGMAIDSALLGV